MRRAITGFVVVAMGACGRDAHLGSDARVDAPALDAPVDAPAKVSTILPGDPSAWTLTFEDTFTAGAIDPTKWHTTYRYDDRSLPSNGEAECYQDDAFRFANNRMQIIAEKKPVDCSKPAASYQY